MKSKIKVSGLFVLGSLLMVGLASCGGNKNANEESANEESGEAIVLWPETTKIKGDLGDYYEVVYKEYTTNKDILYDMVTIEVKRTDENFSFNSEGCEPYGTSGPNVTGNAGFGIEILDENGNVIDKTAAGRGGMYSRDDMIEALKLKAGETSTVRWTFHFDKDKKPAKFRLSSAYESVDSSIGHSSSSDESSDAPSYSSSSSSGSEDWDALLNSYDSYVTKYISYLKKAAKGDMSALAEYPALMEKAQEFSEKMKNAQGDMSAAQWARYIKITNKMAQAASEAQ